MAVQLMVVVVYYMMRMVLASNLRSTDYVLLVMVDGLAEAQDEVGNLMEVVEVYVMLVKIRWYCIQVSAWTSASPLRRIWLDLPKSSKTSRRVFRITPVLIAPVIVRHDELLVNDRRIEKTV